MLYQGHVSVKRLLLTLPIMLFGLILPILADDREPKCSFTQRCIRDGGDPTSVCPDPKNTETPVAQSGTIKMPTWGTKYLQEACPYLVGQELCCNDDQIINMYNNFKTIDSLFGNCLICSINLKRFWCEYTCSPYQAYFLDSFDQIRVSDVDYLVLNQTMRISNDMACDIYKSCNKNPYVASLASGQSAAGFLEFMGSNAVQSGKVKISFDFDTDPEQTLFLDMYACDMEVNETLEGYVVEPCGCNYCEPACRPNDANAYPSFFDGFNVVVVVIVYVSLIVLSVIIYFIKKRWQSTEEEEEMSFADEKDFDSNSQARADSTENLEDDGSRRLLEDVSEDPDMSNSFGKINKSSVIRSLDNSRGLSDTVNNQ